MSTGLKKTYLKNCTKKVNIDSGLRDHKYIPPDILSGRHGCIFDELDAHLNEMIDRYKKGKFHLRGDFPSILNRLSGQNWKVYVHKCIETYFSKSISTFIRIYIFLISSIVVSLLS